MIMMRARRKKEPMSAGDTENMDISPDASTDFTNLKKRREVSNEMGFTVTEV
jgi:hypothetical protein